MNNNIHRVRIGAGKNLFFQHGLAANATQISSLLSGLKGVSVHTLDCPGHGKSELMDNYIPSFNKYADLVVHSLDDQNVARAIIGGLSMGSGIALNMALRYPERVRALVLHRSAWLDQKNPANLKVLLAAVPIFRKDDRIEQFKNSAGFNFINDKYELAGKSLLGVFSQHQQDCLGKVIKAMVGDRPIDNLDKLEKLINIPTLIIGNDNDPMHPFAISETLQQHIKGSVLKKVVSPYIDAERHKKQVQLVIAEFLKNL